jgi:hypothetical protein
MAATYPLFRPTRRTAHKEQAMSEPISATFLAALTEAVFSTLLEQGGLAG